MKKIYVIQLMILINVFNILSQDYIAFPDSGGRWKDILIICWVHDTDTIPTYIKNYHDIVSAGDTIINDTLYFKILQNGYYEGAFRQDSCKIFFRPYYETANEFILYDFCITDKFHSPYFLLDFDVIQIDSVVIGGKKRKRIFFDDENGLYLGQFWIEGIGSSSGFLSPITYEVPSCLEICGAEQYLICHSVNDEILYLNEGYYNCDSAFTSLNELYTDYIAKIYPNPSNGKIIIELKNAKSINYIDIYTIRGELLTRIQNPDTNIIEFKIDNPGLYFIRITENFSITTRKLIIN